MPQWEVEYEETLIRQRLSIFAEEVLIPKREALGLKPKEMATLIGVSPDTVKRVEEEGHFPQQAILERFVTCYGLSGQEKHRWIKLGRGFADPLEKAKKKFVVIEESADDIRTSLEKKEIPKSFATREVERLLNLLKEEIEEFTTIPPELQMNYKRVKSKLNQLLGY